jgi:SSS family solute:Na+ symporter
MGFAAIDYAVLLLYLAGITAFGMLFRRSQRTVKDYFLGARRTSWVVISLSIVATETSTLTLIGIPAQAYAHYARPEQGGALMYLQVVVGYIVARVLISLLFIPAYFQGDLLTAYELLNRRFGARAKHAAASLFLGMRALSEGVRLYATSLVMAAVLATVLPDLPFLWLWSIVAVGVLTLVYTYEGGMAAVIWTDLIQFVIYVGGSLLAGYELLHAVPGGWATVVAVAAPAGKLAAVSFSWDLRLPYTFWAGLIGGTFLTMASHGTDQLLVQRLLTCRTERDSQKALIASGFIVFAQFAFFLVVGVMLFVFYRFHPAPALVSTDQVFPAFIVQNLPHGVAGLVIAAIFAAAMSTLSGALNSLSSTTLVDFLQPLMGTRWDEARLLALSRWLTAGWGVLLILVAIVASGWGSVFEAGLSIASLVWGPMLGAFLLGVLTRRANQTGVIAGMATSLGAMVAVRLFTPLAWTWYVLAGTVVCTAVGYGVSLATARPGRAAGAGQVFRA